MTTKCNAFWTWGWGWGRGEGKDCHKGYDLGKWQNLNMDLRDWIYKWMMASPYIKIELRPMTCSNLPRK